MRRRIRAFEDTGPVARLVIGASRRIARPLRWIGVEPATLETLLQLEFTLGDRRAKRAEQEGSAGPSVVGFGLTLLVNGMFGGVGALALGMVEDPVWAMGLAMSVLMAFLTLTLIGDYLPAMVDTAGIEVIAPLPVGGRTVLAARILHAIGSLGFVVFALSLLPVIVGSATFGPWPFLPVWLLASVMATAVCLGLSFGLFLLAMRLFDVERFRDLMIYMQVIASVALIGGLQLAPRLIDSDTLEALFEDRPWWLALVPSFHGGGLFAFALGDHDRGVITLAVLALLTPVASMALVQALGGSGFVARMAAMASAGRGAPDVRARRRPVRDLLLAPGAQRAGYDFFVALSRRERYFRMRSYPLIAMSAVFGVAFAIREGEVEGDAMLTGAIYCLALYAPAFVLVSRYSETHEARWLFQVAPLARPGDVLLGGLFGLLANFVVPAVVVMALLVLAIGGIGITLDVLFAAESVVVAAALSALLLGRRIPFTEAPIKNPAEGNVGLTMMLSSLTGIWILLHWLLRQSIPAFVAGVLLQPVVGLLVLARLRRVKLQGAWLGAQTHGPA